MGIEIDDVFQTPPGDGIACLPNRPGVYAMLNRVTRLWNVGQSENIRLRCQLHRSQMRAGAAGNMRIRRDVEKHGADSFFYFALEVVTVTPAMNLKNTLNSLELWWVIQCQAHDERFGYVAEAGRRRTMGSRFRDREVNLMRANSNRYQLLPDVDLYNPIHPLLLASWVPGS